MNYLHVILLIHIMFLFPSSGLDRTQERETVSRLWNINTAIMSYASSKKEYPRSNEAHELITDLKTYVAHNNLQQKDGWGGTILYVSSEDHKRFVIASAGRNGMFEFNISSFLYDLPKIEYFNENSNQDDIVIANRCERRLPEGYTSFCDKSWITLINLRNLKETLTLFHLEESTYPKTLSLTQLKTIAKRKSGIEYGLSKIDAWGSQIFYAQRKNGSGYILGSPGRDRVFSVNLYHCLETTKTEFFETRNTDDYIILSGKELIWDDAYI